MIIKSHIFTIAVATSEKKWYSLFTNKIQCNLTLRILQMLCFFKAKPAENIKARESISSWRLYNLLTFFMSSFIIVTLCLLKFTKLVQNNVSVMETLACNNYTFHCSENYRRTVDDKFIPLLSKGEKIATSYKSFVTECNYNPNAA